MPDPYIDYGQPAGMGMTPYDVGYTAPTVRTNTAFGIRTGGNNMGGMNKPYVPLYQAEAKETIGKASTALSTATMIGVGTGLMSGGTGFIVAGLIQLAGGILGALARPKPHRNPEEVAFERMVKFYRDLGKRSNVARSVASLFTGKPKSSFSGVIGYDTPMEAYKKNPNAWKQTGE